MRWLKVRLHVAFKRPLKMGSTGSNGGVYTRRQKDQRYRQQKWAEKCYV